MTKAVEAVCLSECRRVRALGTIQAHAREDVDCLVSAAHRTVSSPTVAQHFATVIAGMCSNNYKNRVACLVAGVIGSLIELLHAHGVYSYRVGEEGCRALGTLASYYPAGADRIASLGGIEAIVIVMASHPMTRAVQGKACRALYQISYSSPATLEVMRSNCRLGELALAAARNHPMDSDRLDSSHHCYSITELLIRVKLGLSATGC